jgi:hydroxymethylpyrimidine pyrophosphatase-like HAD family hydrolase
VDVALETLEGFVREPSYRVRWDAQTDQRVGDLDELLALAPSVVKVLFRKESSSGDVMLAAARRALEGIAQPTHSNANDCLVEVSALGVSKAATLAELAAERGIKAEDVIAFGDMPNDLEMLAWAGRGYAMADGHPEALAAADHVAAPCTEDGVAQVIEDHLRSRFGVAT